MSEAMETSETAAEVGANDTAQTNTMTVKQVHAHPHVRTLVGAVLSGQKTNPPADPKAKFADSIKRGEDAQKFLHRLHNTAVGAITDEDWGTLPEAVQEWHNASVRAIKASGELPMPSGDAGDAPAATAATESKPKRKTVATVPDSEVLSPEEQEAVERARKLLAEVNDKKRAKINPDKAAKAKSASSTPRAPKAGFVSRSAYAEMAKNPNLTVKQLYEIAKANNSDLSEKTCEMIWRNAMNVLTPLKELGLLKTAA